MKPREPAPAEEDRPTLICLTPVKNEAWILGRFLQCASTWADHIVLADQGSDDGSKEIAARYPRVHLIENTSAEYDEVARQRMLVDAARRIPVRGRRILIALDADEVVSANYESSDEWARALTAEPGSVLYFRWANVGPEVSCAWVDTSFKPFGFVDDGSPHVGRRIHSPRIPTPRHATAVYLEDVRILHYQYADWRRMKSKQRWYQCFEQLQDPTKRPVTIFRQYHHMEAAIERAGPVEDEWLAGYESRGIDMRTVESAPWYYWDEEVVSWLEREGPDRFRRLNIWDVDWSDAADALGRDTGGGLHDPRSRVDRAVHHWLLSTQGRSRALPVRAAQKLLQLAGW